MSMDYIRASADIQVHVKFIHLNIQPNKVTV